MNTSTRFAAVASILASLCWYASGAAAASVTVQVNDATGKPLADVVVVAAAEAGVAMPRVQKAGEIEQRGLKFMPLVSVIQTGSRLSFPNYDKVKHHIYSFSPAKKFDQKLYSGVAAAPQVFDKPGLVVLGCNIHDRMVSYIVVVDSPYFAKTGADGVARIEMPSGGKFTVSAWHYNAAAAADQVVAAKGDAALAFKLTLKPAPAEPQPGY
jgi:plastocyanin